MSTLEQRFELISELDKVAHDLGKGKLRDLLWEAASFLWDLCACRSCGSHSARGPHSLKLSCQFCTVCGQHQNSPEIEA